MGHWVMNIKDTKIATKNPGWVDNLEQMTVENDNFRKVLFTSTNCQLVLMSVAPGDDIGSEVHDLDQFIRIESGTGKAILDGFSRALKDGDAIVVPEGVRHNIINTSKDKPLKLYAVYSPPNHKKGTVHKTKADAEEEHFDGETDV